jgi:hypothetical protein
MFAGASLRKAPVLPANIRQGWKGLPGKNALAYYDTHHRHIRHEEESITIMPPCCPLACFTFNKTFFPLSPKLLGITGKGCAVCI